MSYSIYLDEMQFPVVPGKFAVKVRGNNKTLSLVNDGEISFLKAPGLSEVKFDLLLPMLQAYPFAEYPEGFRPPEHYTNKLKAMMVSRKPFQFVLSRVSPAGALLFKTDMRVSLEDYELKEDAKGGLDLTASVSLKECRDFQTVTAIVDQPVPGSAAPGLVTIQKSRPAETAPTVKSYTVVKGDTLWGIAKRQYDDGSRYLEIFNANRGALKDPNKIYPGQVLTIP